MRFMKVVIISLLFLKSTSAFADPITAGSWLEFSFMDPGTLAMGCQPNDPNGLFCEPSSAANSAFLGAPSWAFDAASPVVFRITDAFRAGDQFRVFDFGIPVLLTSFVAQSDYDCGSDPELCFGDPQISAGVYMFQAGAHSLTTMPVLSPSIAGAGYFRLDVVPEPSTLVLIGTGFLVLILGRRVFADTPTCDVSSLHSSNN